MATSDFPKSKINLKLATTIRDLTGRFGEIDADRANLLSAIAKVISVEKKWAMVVLNFICTHNSRRSQIAQAWAIAAASHYATKNIKAVSGGTEVTAFNSRAVRALADQGFELNMNVKTVNPGYLLSVNNEEIIEMYSKTFQQATLESFIAIMTCDHADRNCPLVTGAIERFSLPFKDPGFSDGAPDEEAVYRRTADLIGCEMLYLFSLVR
ncbi:MAG: protein-tyrosine-phosphatase [Cyclobacteriaceae bacterium]